jgi:hypothetical protein
MPTLLEEVDVKLERSDLDRRTALARVVSADNLIVQPGRAPGLHASGLIRYVAESSRISARMADIADEEMPLRWAMGQAWEEYAASLYPDMCWQPGERYEPLIMNADGLSIIHDELVVEEFKFMRSKKISAERFLDSRYNWLKLQQGVIYCLGYGADIVRWHVLNALEWPDPKYTQYKVRFEEKELAATARMIETNRAAAISKGYSE